MYNIWLYIWLHHFVIHSATEHLYIDYALFSHLVILIIDEMETWRQMQRKFVDQCDIFLHKYFVHLEHIFFTSPRYLQRVEERNCTQDIPNRCHELTAKRLTRLEGVTAARAWSQCHVKQAEWIENGFQIEAIEKSSIHKKTYWCFNFIRFVASFCILIAQIKKWYRVCVSS